MNEKSAALGVGTLASVVAAFPAVPRLTAEGANAVLAVVSLSGGAALVLGPALVLSRAAGGVTPGLRTALFGFALAATPLTLLGSSLKQGTHHRPLGAATFAVLALATILFFVGVVWRILRWAEAEESRVRRGALIAMAVAALASIGFVIARSLGSPAVVPHVLDGLRALSTAALGYLLLRFPRTTRVLGRLGGPLWAFVVVAALVVARGATFPLVRSAAPVLGGPLAWF